MELLNLDAYAWGWIIYCAGFLLCFWVASRLIRLIPFYVVRQTLKAILIVLFLTPVASHEVANWYNPAWLYLGYESILGNEEHALQALTNLGIGAAIMLFVLCIDIPLHYRRRT
ncbi:hypothetical protein QQM79_01425 [Marinobacteraceae bacterium S3BR75-40.1]